MMSDARALKGMLEKAEIADLFPELEQSIAAREKADERAKALSDQIAAAAAAVYRTPAGRLLLDWIAGEARRFENVTALGLPLETAIQIYAHKDGKRELAEQLARLVHQGMTAG
jgi:hypothetical protein